MTICKLFLIQSLGFCLLQPLSQAKSPLQAEPPLQLQAQPSPVAPTGRIQSGSVKAFYSRCLLTPLDATVTALFSLGQGVLKSTQTVYQFSETGIRRWTVAYPTMNCSGTPGVSFVEGGTYRVLTPVTTSDGGRNMDINFNSLQVLIQTPAGAKAANAMWLCGVNTWVPGQRMDVTTQSWDPRCYNSLVPRSVANVYLMSGNTLYLGTDTKSRVGESSRPTRLERQSPFVQRQAPQR